MSTQEAVLRALGKKVPFEVNYELVDRTDVMDIINREREDVELLENALKEGRENIAMGGLKLRQSAEVSRFPNPAGSSGFRSVDSPSKLTHKPRLIHAVFLTSLLALLATSLFTLFDSMTVVEVAYKVHALAGLVSQNREPLREERVLRWKGTGLLLDDKEKKPSTRKSYEASDSFNPLAKNWNRMPIPVNPPAVNDADVLSRRQSAHPGCQGNSTTSSYIVGLPAPGEGFLIRLTSGLVHTLHIVSIDLFGQQRCAGGDYYETDLRSSAWKSRPPVLDLRNGSYVVKLHVDPRFAGRFVFKVTLLFSNFDGLKQLDPLLSNHEYKKIFRDKLIASFSIEFVPPEKAAPISIFKDANPQPRELEVSDLKLKTCRSEDFKPRRWSGRWTRGTFNPNCSIDSNDSGRFKCLDPETKCDSPWCEGDVGRLDSNGWVYSAHCSFKIFSPDEAWQCLDGKWLFWWSDSDDQENTMVRDLLKSVLGLSLPEGRWDGMGRFSNKVFVRPDGTEKAQVDHITKASLRARSLKQQVRMTNMWNANIISNPEHFQGVISSYFSKFSSPDIVIMNSGLHDGVRWHSWDEFVKVGMHNVTNCWKEIFESVVPNRRPSIVFTTTGAQGLSDFNPQLMEMYTSSALNAYLTANLTFDFKLVDGFDYSISWMGRYTGNQNFVDLMNVHMLLNALCTVD